MLVCMRYDRAKGALQNMLESVSKVMLCLRRLLHAWLAARDEISAESTHILLASVNDYTCWQLCPAVRLQRLDRIYLCVSCVSNNGFSLSTWPAVRKWAQYEGEARLLNRTQL
jgi:hypothetical protein